MNIYDNTMEECIPKSRVKPARYRKPPLMIGEADQAKILGMAEVQTDW